MADSLYGESSSVIDTLEALNFDFIVAIRSNHSGLVAPGERVRYNRWKAYQQELSHRQPEPRFVREIIFGNVVKFTTTKLPKGILLTQMGTGVGIL